jgi:outer membrane protein OmpU
MRKQLLAGTALVAAAMLATGGAVAADKKMMKPSISVGGFFNHEVGGILDTTQETTTKAADGAVTKVNNEKDTSGLDSRSDVEVFFSGSATLDNGIKIATRVELEGDTDAKDQIDETWMTISGSFGQITLGNDDNAPDKMLGAYAGQWATQVGSSPFLRGISWVGNASGLGRYSGLGDTDANKVTYISPKLGGFSVGMSYTPTPSDEGSNANPDATIERHDGLSGAIAYSGNFGDVSIGGGVGIRTTQGSTGAGSENSEDEQAWNMAGRLGFGPVTIAAAYMKATDPMADRSDVVDLGVRFVQGSNSFSLSGTHSKADEGDARLTIVIGSYARALGPGVKLHTDLIWNQSQSDTATDADGVTTQTENSGTAFVTGIKVTF